MKCVCCDGTKFIGHQIIRADILVDEHGEFLENLPGCLEAHIYDSEKPYGPFTCLQCGAEYDTLESDSKPLNRQMLPDGSWPDSDRLVEGTFTSVWDGGIAISSRCMVNMRTGQIVYIEQVDVEGGLDNLQEEYVVIKNKKYKVVSEEEYDEENGGFWYQ